VRIAPTGTPVHNPAFDVTPAELVTAFVTEAGVLRPPYRDSLRAAVRAGLPKAAAAGAGSGVNAGAGSAVNAGAG
jgi:methylthioribose-1-phosphate isomerase